MIKKITILTIVIVTVIAYAITYKNANNAFSSSSGSPGGYTASPGDNKDCGSCHGGTATAVTGWITSNIPGSGYVANTSYTISVTATGSTSVNKGFEFTAETSAKTKVGTYTAGTGTKLVNSNKAVTQSSTVSSSPKTWTFTWKSPAAGTGTITFYACFALGQSGSNKKCSLAISEGTSVGLDPVSNENILIRFYPNPASNNLVVVNSGTEEINLSVYNIQGQLLAEQASHQNITSMNISNLEKGIYLLKAESSKGSEIKRFIKE